MCGRSHHFRSTTSAELDATYDHQPLFGSQEKDRTTHVRTLFLAFQSTNDLASANTPASQYGHPFAAPLGSANTRSSLPPVRRARS